MVRAGLRMATIAIAVAAAAPAAAQMMSDGYEFLEAVRDRDGVKVSEALSRPGTVLVNSRDIGTGETALHIVTQRRDAVWIRFLTQNGANPNVADENGVTPLEIAGRLGFAEGVKELLEAGARVDAPNATGETPLIAAIHGALRRPRRSARTAPRSRRRGAARFRAEPCCRRRRARARRRGRG